MTCPGCGAELPQGSAFCHVCGRPLAAAGGAGPGQPRQAAPGGERTNYFPVIGALAAVGAVVAVLAVVLSGSGGGSDEDAVRSIIQKEAAYLKGDRPEAFYSLYSPDSREYCDYDAFLEMWEEVQDYLDDSDIAVRDIEVSVEGETAYASYEWVWEGESTPEYGDEFVKIDGKWYNEDEEGDLCY